MDDDKTFLGMCIIAVLVFFFIAYVSQSEHSNHTDRTMGAAASQQQRASDEISGARDAGAGATEANERAAAEVERSQAAVGTIASGIEGLEREVRECRRLAASSEQIFRDVDRTTGSGADAGQKE